MSKKIFFVTLSILAMVGTTSAMRQLLFKQPPASGEINSCEISGFNGDRITIGFASGGSALGLSFATHSRHFPSKWKLMAAYDMHEAIENGNLKRVRDIISEMNDDYPERYFDSVFVDGIPLLCCAISKPKIYMWLVNEVGLNDSAKVSFLDHNSPTIKQLFLDRWGLEPDQMNEDDSDDDEGFDSPLDDDLSCA